MNDVQVLYDVIYDIVMLDDQPGDKEICEYIITHFNIEKVYDNFSRDLEKFSDWVREFM